MGNQVKGPQIQLENLYTETPLVKEINQPHSPRREMTFSNQDFKKIDLSWEHLNIQAIINKKVIQNGKKKTVRETKTILNNISGSVRNGEFTAIMGPSGRYFINLLVLKFIRFG